MEREYHPQIAQTVNAFRAEIGEHSYIVAESDWWIGRGIRSPFSRLYLIEDGDGWIRTAQGVVPLKAGHAYWVPAGLTFDYGCETYIRKLYFHLQLIRPDGYDLAEGLPFAAACEMEEGEFETLLGAYRGERWIDALTLRQGIEAVTRRLLESYGVLEDGVRSYSPPVERAMQFVQSHLSAALTVDEIAQAAFTSPATLSRRFRQEVGKTPRQYAEDMVFHAARRLLADTTRPLAQISEELGFGDPFYFSRRFRQRVGEPPSHYRSRTRSLF